MLTATAAVLAGAEPEAPDDHSAAPLPARELFALGGERLYWVVQVQTEQQEEGEGLRTLIRVRELGAAGRWRRIDPLSMRGVDLAERGSELALLLEDGRWLLVWPEDTRRGGPLPGRGVALGSDGRNVWALTAVAEEQELSLLQEDRGRWIERARLPVDAVPPPQQVALAVQGDAVVLALLEAAGTIRTMRWTEADGWQDAGMVEPADPVVVMDLLRSGGRIGLWTAGQRGAGELRYLNDQWAEPLGLAPGATAALAEAGGPRALAMAGGVLRLLFMHEGELYEQRLEADGRAADEPVALLLPRPAAPDPTLRYWINMVLLGVLVLVIISTLRRRRAMAETIAHADQLRLAPFGVRFLAGSIDAVPMLVALMITGARIGAPEEAAERLMEPQFWVPLAAGAGVYLLHTTLLELLLDRSLGKMIFGLRVAGLDGRRPSRTAVLLRNVLRLVDLYLLFPLVLVLFSPLRQRIGDVAAATLVVTSPPPAEDEQKESQQPQETMRGRYD